MPGIGMCQVSSAGKRLGRASIKTPKSRNLHGEHQCLGTMDLPMLRHFSWVTDQIFSNYEENLLQNQYSEGCLCQHEYVVCITVDKGEAHVAAPQISSKGSAIY